MFLFFLFVCVFVAEAVRVGPEECEMLHSADKTRSLLILLDVEATSGGCGPRCSAQMRKLRQTTCNEMSFKTEHFRN